MVQNTAWFKKVMFKRRRLTYDYKKYDCKYTYFESFMISINGWTFLKKSIANFNNIVVFKTAAALNYMDFVAVGPLLYYGLFL